MWITVLNKDLELPKKVQKRFVEMLTIYAFVKTLFFTEPN